MAKIPFGKIEAFNVLVEIPRGSQNKYEYDEATDKIRLDFVLQGGVKFPYSYGFIPATRGGDGDYLDAIVISTHPIDIKVVAVCKTIGMLSVIDRGEQDDKFICVPLCDPLAEKLNDVSDLPKELLAEWNEFLMEIARQKKKVMVVKAVLDKHRAMTEIKSSLE